MGLPSCVPKGFCSTACSCLFLACAAASPPIARLCITITHTVLRCLGVMRESVLRAPGSWRVAPRCDPCLSGTEKTVELRSPGQPGSSLSPHRHYFLIWPLRFREQPSINPNGLPADE